MTELQIGLIGLGAVAVVGVMVFNTWQEYRHRKLAQQVLNEPHPDVLLDESDTGQSGSERGENPSDDRFAPQALRSNAPVTPSVVSESPALHSSGERIEPVFRMDADEAPMEHLSSVPLAQKTVSRSPDQVKDNVELHHLLSPAIDYVAAIQAVEPVPAYQIIESQRDALARIRKPVHWIGYNERSHEWEVIVDNGESEYQHIRVGLQLVDRQGPLGDSDIQVFHGAMQDLADELMAISDLPERQSALDTASQLDEFCASVDIQIGINVISETQVFPGTKIRALAESAGMVIDVEGRFVRCDEDGNVLYMLINQEASGFSVESMKTMSTHALTFLLDVPRVAHGDRVFNQMVDLARRFADVLHGVLVDDNHRPLSESALEPIRRQVAQYQSAMAAHSLPAGGPLALRLFS